MIPNFAEYELSIEGQDQSGAKSSQKIPVRSTIGGYTGTDSKELMNSIEMIALKKKMEEKMNN